MRTRCQTPGAGKLRARMGDYVYELRSGDAVIATGRIQLEEAPTPGETLSLGSQRVLVSDVLRLGGTPRLILAQS